ncbi:hypothetical protein FRB91_006323 [Serendipita sp. 411]|nr:hypothetical protein FRB91_006323 [Serendipita sp. 411]
MLDLISSLERVRKSAIDAITRLDVSQTDETLTLRSRWLSLYKEAHFTSLTLSLALGDGSLHPQPSIPDLALVENALRDILVLSSDEVLVLDPNSLRSAQLELSKANKDLCRRIWDIVWVFPNVDSLPPLLRLFAQNPFRVTAADIPDDHFHEPISQLFKGSVANEMKSLFESIMHSTEPQAHGTRSLLHRLLLSLWCDAAPTLQQWGSELSLLHRTNDEKALLATTEQLRAAIDLFDQGLRDLLVRKRRDKLSVAFVGMQGCGKSSFLNYIIGRNLLLEEVGQATTYPCRIEHRPGQAVPELTIETTYLNERLVLIREKPIFRALKAVGWDGKSLLSNPSFSSEIRRWANFLRREKVKGSLAVIAEPSFALKGPFLGDEAVSTALQHTNHIVSICHLLDIPFELFSDARWATITVEFGEVGKLDEPYELLDLPGLYGNTNRMYWQDLVRETIRHAKVVIVMISASDVLSNKENAEVWREIPQMISSSTSVAPSAVVLTQSDRISVYPKQEQAERFREIREEFWPDAIDLSPCQIYECSVLEGRSGKALVRAIESSNKLDVATLWHTHASYAVSVVLNAESLEKAEVLIQNVPLAQVKSSAGQIEERSNIGKTTKGILELIEKEANKETIRETEGISRRVLQLLSLLRDLMYELQLLSSEEIEALETRSKLEQEQSSILIEWAEKEGLLIRDYQRLSKETREALDERVRVLVQDAAKGRQTSDLSAFDLADDHKRIYFLDETAAKDFVTFLRDRLVAVQNEALASLKERVYSTMQELFIDLAKRAGQLDASIEAPLLSLVSREEIKPLISKTEMHGLTTDELVTKQKVPIRRSRGYKAAQDRTLAWMTRGQGHSVDELSLLYRSILELATPFSYILFPPSRQPEEATLYHVDLDAVLIAFQSVASTFWNESVSQDQQERLKDVTKRGKDLIGGFSLVRASDSSAVRAVSPARLDDGMQSIIIAGYLNLIGMLASQETIAAGWSYSSVL